MGQIYLQRFEYMGPVSKTDFDEVWGVALQTFARSGNWGGVDQGVKHVRGYGTGWGGYAVIEVEDPAAFEKYQAHHNQNYGRIAKITWEPVYDLDAAFEPVLQGMRARQ